MAQHPLTPDDFPVSAEDEQVITDSGKPVAEAKSKSLAKDIAERLNEDAARKEEDRWSL
jgi:hypothetical protein